MHLEEASQLDNFIIYITDTRYHTVQNFGGRKYWPIIIDFRADPARGVKEEGLRN